MNVLVLGGGGREHALAWKLSQSDRIRELLCAPGNAGTATCARNLSCDPSSPDAVSRLAREHAADLVVVGPEAPLVAGVADRLRGDGVAVFGPSRDGARLEGSKRWAKEFMQRHGIPTAPFRAFGDAGEALAWVGEKCAPLAVKADGLAGGKGVRVAATREEAADAVRAFLLRGEVGAAGREVVIEDALQGCELSLLVVTDGKRALALPPARDHKRAGDGDTGPNTGGMGAFAPAPLASPDLLERIERDIVQRTLAGLRAEGVDYRGVLYVGLMLTDEGPQVLEYNCRFGDPETQAVLPLLGSDLAELCAAAAAGDLGGHALRLRDGACVAVVLAAGGYPGAHPTGFPIEGVEEAEASDGVVVFHAGTRRDERGRLVTAGGRVLAVSALGAQREEAVERAYRAASCITFEGAQMRRDIGRAAPDGVGCGAR